MTTYKFVARFDEPDKVDETTKSFLQIASFEHPKNKLYHVRKFNINETNEFVNIKEYHVSKNKHNRLLRKKNKNEYKLYSVYSLNDVDYPNMSDILAMKSDILQSKYNYYGSAPF